MSPRAPSRNPLKPKERMAIPRQEMPQRDALERSCTYDEVNLGFDVELAKQEALRCLECANPRCVEGCPVGVAIREFVDLVLSGDYLGAARKMREANVLPAITGRVCPQEDACEGACVLIAKVPPLAIGHLERFVADYERREGKVGLPPIAAPTGKKIAIVGSGPAGLACAGDLIQKGHVVTVFEALHEVGGVLIYGIPAFRLPRDIVRQEKEMPARIEEVRHAKEEGIEFLGDEKGNLVAARCVQMTLGEPDASGRRRPMVVHGSEFEVPLSMVVIAAGTSANPIVQSTTPDLMTREKGYIVADPETLRTSKPGVFAGGDIVTGGATVILAMGAGRKAAKAVHEYLASGTWEKGY